MRWPRSLRRLFSSRRDTYTDSEVVLDESQIADQLRIFSGIDGIPLNVLRLQSDAYYIRARQLEEKGYEITAKKTEGGDEIIENLSTRLIQAERQDGI